MWLAVRVVAAVLATSGVAHASQVGFRPEGLAEAVRSAELIVVVERIVEGVRKHKPARAELGRFRVIETLRAPSKGAAPAAELTVFAAGRELDEAMAAHIAKHGYQGLPSPIVPQYSSSLDDEAFARAPRVILFLRRWHGDWQLAIERGWEAVAHQADVAAAAKSKP